MIQVSREAVGLYHEHRTVLQSKLNWFLVTFPVSRVGFSQHSSRDHYSIKFPALSLYFNVNGWDCFCKTKSCGHSVLSQRYQTVPLGNLLVLSNDRFFSFGNVTSIFYFFLVEVGELLILKHFLLSFS